jgi:DNA-binding NarL/FixJ family response regulator
MRIRVLIGADLPLIAAGISAVLDSDPELAVVAHVPTSDVVETIAAHDPDVVIIDLRSDGVELIAKAASGNARVLVLGSSGEATLVCAALYAGAAGYLITDSPMAVFPAAVRLAAAGGGTVLGPAVVEGMLRALGGRPVVTAGQSSALTPREQDVLELMAQGMSNEEIGRQLFISSLTARTHVSRTIMKLGARNRAHAVTTAYRTGLIELSRYDIRRTHTPH